MDEISKLLKEAKPLYFARKKKRRQIKSVTAMLLCVVMLGIFYPRGDNSPILSYSDMFYAYENEMIQAENGSVIEDMGLPVDEYGLLMVS